MARNRSVLLQVDAKPLKEKLPWLGLKAGDRLSRVATAAVKEMRESREMKCWAAEQIARVLDHVSVETAIGMILRESRRRQKRV